eukprot:scaffold118429_cov59-Phaeocystis_antarctica.AAC.10
MSGGGSRPRDRHKRIKRPQNHTIPHVGRSDLAGAGRERRRDPRMPRGVGYGPGRSPRWSPVHAYTMTVGPRHTTSSRSVPVELVVVAPFQLLDDHVVVDGGAAGRLELHAPADGPLDGGQPRAARAVGLVAAGQGAEDRLGLGRVGEGRVAEEHRSVGAPPARVRRCCRAVARVAKVPTEGAEGALALEGHRVDEVCRHQQPRRRAGGGGREPALPWRRGASGLQPRRCAGGLGCVAAGLYASQQLERLAHV